MDTKIGTGNTADAAAGDPQQRILSVEEMLAAPDVQYDTIPAWGGVVRIGSLTAGEMIEFAEANEGPAKRTAGIRLIVRSLVDKDGNRIGTDKHIEAFKAKNAVETNKVVEAILKLNGLNLKKDEKEKEKNA